MGRESRRPRPDRVEQHSLPGTNQAGKGPGTCEEPGRPKNSSEEGVLRPNGLSRHSLPGTDQAGKGSRSADKRS